MRERKTFKLILVYIFGISCALTLAYGFGLVLDAWGFKMALAYWGGITTIALFGILAYAYTRLD